MNILVTFEMVDVEACWSMLKLKIDLIIFVFSENTRLYPSTGFIMVMTRRIQPSPGGDIIIGVPNLVI